jgi:hypothetical protein
MPDAKILMYCGYDVLIYLKCLKLGFWTCAYFTPFGLLLLASNLFRGDASASGYFQTTISNLGRSEHSDLGLPLAGTVILHFIIMALTVNTHLEYMQLRRSWLQHRRHNATIFVTDIPVTLRSESVLKQYFQSIYRCPVISVNFVKRVDDLDKAVAAREKTVMALERSIIQDYVRSRRDGSLASETPEAASNGTPFVGEEKDDSSNSVVDSSDESDSDSDGSLAPPPPPPPPQESVATLKLRERLSQQNDQVKNLQAYYLSQSKVHDELMSELASDILSKRLNVTVRNDTSALY